MTEKVIYAGTRTDSCTDIKVTKNGQIFSPRSSQKLWNHSPDGFNWGYGGSGPAQLALALLFDATGDKELAKRHHQRFKSNIVARFENEWEYTEEQIKEWIQEHVRDDNAC